MRYRHTTLRITHLEESLEFFINKFRLVEVSHNIYCQDMR